MDIGEMEADMDSFLFRFYVWCDHGWNMVGNCAVEGCENGCR